MNKQRYSRGRKRTEFLAFYVSKEEKETIFEKAKKQDLTLSDYCRKILMKDAKTEDVFE